MSGDNQQESVEQNVQGLREECCVICREDLGGDIERVYEKGLRTLVNISSRRVDTELHDFLRGKLDSKPIGKVYVHKIQGCRNTYTKHPDRQLKRASPTPVTDTPSTKRLRSSQGPFDWFTDCYFCAKPAIEDPKHPDRIVVSEVTFIEFRDYMVEQCKKRGDNWGQIVLTRLNGCVDLVAAEGRYHRQCYKDFIQIPTGAPSGRPVDTDKFHSFEALCTWLEEEGETETMTIAELHTKMTTIANGKNVYGEKSLRTKLEERYGDQIFWSKVKGGRDDVLCFRNMASRIIHKNWHSEKIQDIQLESERIVKTCAELLKADIRAAKYSKENFPNSADIKDITNGRNFMSPLTRVFMENIIKDDVKRNSIGQALTQATRPHSVLSPILFGTAVQMDHVFGSRWLVDELFQLGFCVSYDELILYKQSILSQENIDTFMPPAAADITQYSADNADHAVRTIDGLNQFHGMGIIAMSSVNDASMGTDQRVKRIERTTVSRLIDSKGIKITKYVGPESPALSTVKFKPLIELVRPHITPPLFYYTNMIWQSARVFVKSSIQTPNFSGFMQHFSKSFDVDVTKSHILYLPFIDLNPNDETCIYSTLLYINDQSAKLQQESVSLTFDQPLWHKAVEIIQAKGLKQIVCRLGGFHLLMSAFGSLFHIMKGSGLSDAMEQLYGPVTVNHISTGKAIAKSLRCHFIVERALTTLLFEAVLPPKSGEINNETSHLDKLTEEENLELEKLIERVHSENPPLIDDLVESEPLAQLDKYVSEYKEYLCAKSRTAKLWILYLHYVSIIKEFISCERSCDWEGHLTAVGKLLNLFAATGHINYAKSGRLYLQMMRDLPEKHPWLYQKFTEGHHAVRRSDKYWAGLWTDLCIEQELMRSMKARGGLTRGRGMTESVRHQWIYTMHQCASIHDAMTCLTNKHHSTSEQHAELGKSRCTRDSKDLDKVIEWFKEHNPFDITVPSLRSITTGLTATEDDGINCDETESIGQQIQQSLSDLPVNKVHIKRSHQVQTLAILQPGIKKGKKTISIEPSILFLRCVALAKRASEDIEEYFKYEMSAVPTALFKDNCLRKTDKSDLARALKKDVANLDGSISMDTSKIVIDGGWLLRRVRWQKNATYITLAEQYETYLATKYGKCYIVFDGYETPSTKDHEHLRRTLKYSADITVTDTSICCVDQEAFLSNSKNKTQFIALLAHVLQSKGHFTKCSQWDADTLIVSTAIGLASDGNSCVVIAEDTDIFVLLVHHWTSDMADIYMRSEGKNTPHGRKAAEVYNIRDIHAHSNPVVRENILFVHAWSGCDTTSATFSQGKKHILRLLSTSKKLSKLAETFVKPQNTVQEVGKIGQTVFCFLYGSEGTSLTNLRYMKYQDMVARCSRIEPERLPPTERAAHYHSLRVFYQIMDWTHMDNNHLDALEWGWTKDKKGIVNPIMTDLAAAPSKVIKFICCKCKSNKQRQCATNVCSCQKHGLKCVDACSGCHGEGCCNTPDILTNEDDREEDVDNTV